ncbi:MAG TPA: branched-chain amino acid ABC transporter permease [Streptosporangiaceae bacterium]|nr:branched-chain amino acid ABC transporter permease [Streptosporangiaceae bacterium]
MSVLARWGRPGLLAVMMVTGLAFPLVVTNALDTNIAIVTLLFAAGVVAWNIFSGYTGYVSLGHAVFFGTGAYTVGLIALDHDLNSSVVFATLPLGGLAAAIVAVPFGLIALRVRRHAFVVVTIAVFFIAQLMAYDLGVTHGVAGVTIPLLNWASATYNNPFYYAAFLTLTATVALSWLIRNSRFGLRLRAIRDDEDRARGLGVRPMPVKLAAFVLSAFITGVVGGIWVLFIGQALPSSAFDPLYDLQIALMGFLGGFGTLWGPVIGAFILEPTQQYITLQFTTGYATQIVLGGLFLLVVLFMPRGLLPTGGERLSAARAWWSRRRPSQPVPVEPGAEPSAAGPLSPARQTSTSPPGSAG